MVSVRETMCEGQGQSLGPAGTTTAALFLGALSPGGVGHHPHTA